jgi:hypothetical protein
MFAQDHKGRLPGNHDDALDSWAANPDPEKRSWLSGDYVSQATTLVDAPQKGTLYRYVNNMGVYRCPGRDQLGGRTSGASFTNERFDYTAVKCLTGARVSNIPNESRYVFVPGPGQIRLPTPYFVEETSFRIVLHNIDGGWSNVDEHSFHHRGGSYYAAMDGSVHWFKGRKKAPETDRAEAWQWWTKSPTRGEIRLGEYAAPVRWGWFDGSF